MTPLIARMLKHAFMSGFVAGKYSDPKDEGAGAKRWVEYEPHEKDLAKLLHDEVNERTSDMKKTRTDMK